MITVVDAKPMDQVGFRGMPATTPTTPTSPMSQTPNPVKKGRPEITILDARPLGDVPFKDVSSVSNNQDGASHGNSSQSGERSPLSPSGGQIGSEAGGASGAQTADPIYAEVQPKKKGPPARPKTGRTI